MEKGCCALLLCLLSVLWRGAVGDVSDPVLKMAGEDAVLNWDLPSQPPPLLTVALQSPVGTVPLFFGKTTEAGKITLKTAFEGRVDVLDSLSAGVVTFTLKSLTPDDAGRYVCINGFGDAVVVADCGQMLVLIDAPQDPTVLTSGPAVENQDLTLECRANSTSLPPDHGLPLQVQWFDSERAQLPASGGGGRGEVVGERLVVAAVQRSDLGLQFSCWASDGLGVWSQDSQAYVLNPEYAPTEGDMVMTDSQVSVNQGGSLQQLCSATCNPECVVTWQRLAELGNFYTVETQGGLLDILSVQRDSSGQYYCRAENEHGSATLTLDVDVQYAPNMRALLVDGTEPGAAGATGVKTARVKEGADVTLTCTFDSNPAPTVTWLGQGDVTLAEETLRQEDAVETEVNSVPMTTFTSSLVLSGVQCSNTSTLTCTAANAQGSGADGQVQLNVICMPRNTLGDMSLKQLYLSPADQAFSVSFEVEAFPVPEISRILSESEQGHRRLEVKDASWQVNTMRQSSHPYLTRFDLTMPSVGPDSFDRTYYLSIENTEGTKVLAFQLKELGAPKPPRNVTVGWADDSSVHLRWIPGFHGGKPQRFSVHYRHSDLEEEEGGWISVPALSQETLEATPKEMTIGGLTSGVSYRIYISARNQFGNSSSSFLTVTTLALAASAGGSGGVIAGAIIGVIAILAIIAVLVFIFVIRPRRNKDKTRSRDFSKEPMLVDTANNNADTDSRPMPPPPVAPKPQRYSTGPQSNGPDKLIYADLALAKPADPTALPARKDAVNYETIDFTRTAPPPDPDNIELASDQEEMA